MTAPQPPDPAAELLALEREREARRERTMRDVRHALAAFIIIVCVLVLLLAWLSSR